MQFASSSDGILSRAALFLELYLNDCRRKKELQNENRRHSKHKIPVLRLMMESAHSDHAANTSANHGS